MKAIRNSPEETSFEEKPTSRYALVGGMSRRKGISLVVLFAMVQTNFWIIEHDKHLQDPNRSGLNGQVFITVMLSMYILASFLDTALDTFPRAKALDLEKRRKLLVHALETTWGTFVLALMTTMFVRIYILRHPEGCDVEYVSLEKFTSPPPAFRTEGLPSEALGFPVVNPGSDVLVLSTAETERFQKLTNDCAYQNMYWMEFAAASVVSMYIFELITLMSYMRVSLLIHHFVAIGLVYLYAAFPQSTVTFLLVFQQLFFAVFEQPTFIALILYRLSDNKKLHAQWFLAGALSFFTTKVIAATLFIYFEATIPDLPRYLVPVLLCFQVPGSLAQLYSAYAQFMMYLRIKKQERRSKRSRSSQNSNEDESNKISANSADKAQMKTDPLDSPKPQDTDSDSGSSEDDNLELEIV